MAAITTAQAGNWSAVATWTGGVVPGNGDTVTLNHSVTVDVATIVGSSPATGGTAAIAWGTTDVVLTINANLTLRGDLSIYSSGTDKNLLVQAAGVTVTFDASQAAAPSTTQYRILNSQLGGTGTLQLWHWVMNGTAASPCVLQTNAAGPNAWHDRNSTLGGFFHTTYGHFISIGDASHPALDTYVGTGSPEVYFDHCVFDGCGEVQYGGTAVAAAVVHVQNTVWKNGVGLDGGFNQLVDLSLPTASGTAECTVNNNYFGNVLVLGGLLGTTLSECVCAGCLSGTLTDAGPTGVQHILQGMKYGSTLLSTSNYDSSYFINFDSTNSNPHGPNANPNHDSGVTNSIFESLYPTAAGGDFVFDCANARNVTLTGNILLPAGDGKAPGKLLSCLQVAATCAITVNHNTVISDLSGSAETGIVQYGETGGGGVGEVVSLKSNLVWSNTAAKGAALTRLLGTQKDEVLSANADYNGFWNPANDGVNKQGYYDEVTPANLFSSGTPGSHDVVIAANPFLDSSRNFAKWGASLGGLGTSTDTLDLMRKRLDWTDPAYAPSNGATVSALVAWVQNGFVVTNPALNNAGADGVTIGAMPYQQVSTSGNTGRRRFGVRHWSTS